MSADQTGELPMIREKDDSSFHWVMWDLCERGGKKTEATVVIQCAVSEVILPCLE